MIHCLLPYLLPYLYPYLLAYLLAYFLTYLLTHLLPYLLNYFLTYFLTHFITYLLTYWLTDLLSYWLTCLLTYLLTHSLTHSLTPWSTTLLEKLTGVQLVKNFPAFYGTRRFITAFTSAHHLSLPLASSIQSITPNSTSYRCILILSSHIRLGQVVSFPQVTSPKPCIRLSYPPYALHAPSILLFSILSPEKYWVKSTEQFLCTYVHPYIYKKCLLNAGE
jgi:hypothetical protein